MGKMGGSRHLKRFAAPKFWRVARKTYKWVVKPIPGPHPIDNCIPLQLLIRDYLGLAHTAKEVKFILNRGYVKVDGKVVRERRFPVGLMDVVYFEKLDRAYRILPSKKGLLPHPIPPEEASFKLRKIMGKSTVKGGHIQLHMHDGYNMLIRVSDPRNPVEDVYKTHDVLKMNLADSSVLEHIRLEKGTWVLIVGGRNVGRWGRMVEIIPGSLTSDPSALIEAEDGSKLYTALKYVFPIGVEKPCISLPEV